MFSFSCSHIFANTHYLSIISWLCLSWCVSCLSRNHDGPFLARWIKSLSFTCHDSCLSYSSRQSHICQPNNTLHWRHNELDGVSDHQPHDWLLTYLFRHRSKKTSKLRVTGLCAGNSPVTGEFPARKASNAENVSNWWHHHELSEEQQGHGSIPPNEISDKTNYTFSKL